MRLAREWLLGSLDGPVSLRLRLDTVVPTFALLLAGLLLAGFALQAGSLGGADLRAVLRGDAPPQISAVMLQWRLPRVVFALVFGAALGMAGAIFQSLIRNPLGSPDLIGFNTGAHTGALCAIVFLQGNHFHIALGAVGGGLAAAALVWLLAWRRGLHGLRLVLIGIGVSALLSAFNTWLSLSANLDTAMSAALWGAGSLNGIGWDKGLPAAAIAGAAMLAGLCLGPRLRLLDMGDASATSLGVAAVPARLWLMGVGVALTAAATAACGPIAFIALAAPPIAQRLGGGLLRSAVVGALLLLAADIVAQHAFAPQQLPVGVITSSVGGLYLVALLLRQNRSSTFS